MFKNEDMDLALLMIAVTAEKELMVLLNSGLIIIRDLQRKINPSLDHTVEFFVEDVSNPESLELSCSKKSKPLKELNKQPRNDFAPI